MNNLAGPMTVTKEKGIPIMVRDIIEKITRLEELMLSLETKLDSALVGGFSSDKKSESIPRDTAQSSIAHNLSIQSDRLHSLCNLTSDLIERLDI